MNHITTSTPKARSCHMCDFCYRTIEPGETYTRTVSVQDCICVWKSCTHCEAMIRICDIEEWNLGDGIDRDHFVDLEVRDIFEARCKVMWHRKWRRKDGTLYPIPERKAS